YFVLIYFIPWFFRIIFVNFLCNCNRYIDEIFYFYFYIPYFLNSFRVNIILHFTFLGQFSKAVVVTIKLIYIFLIFRWLFRVTIINMKFRSLQLLQILFFNPTLDCTTTSWQDNNLICIRKVN